MISVIIPAYNEAPRIARVIGEANQYADEIVVVDDASTDDTAAVAEAAGARVVRQQVNSGYVSAIQTGFRAAQGDVLVTLDADGEFDPADIPDLVAPILSGSASLVLGQRSSIHRPSERFLNWLAGLRVPGGLDSGTGLRALRRSLALELTWPGACICGISVLEPAAQGARITQVPVHLRPVDKPRRIAWYHVRQFFQLLPWLLRRSNRQNQ